LPRHLLPLTLADEPIAEAARAVNAEAELAVARAKASDDQALIAHLKLQIEKLRQWKVIQHGREKFTCRDCEKISQAPAPFHVTARGWAGPSLLAMVLFEKFGQHQPLNRQAERYAKEGVPISLSTLADQVGGCTAALTPLFKRLEAYVLSAERLHGDDTTVPVLAKGKTDTGRIWAYVRDDKPFGGPAPAGGGVVFLARSGR
jgi:transposase